MKILAIDTSTPYAFIGSCVFNRTWSVIDFSISKIKRESDNWLEDLVKVFCTKTALHEYDGFAVGRGPGSFTGLRIGYTYFKTLALLWNKIFVDFSTPDLMNSVFCRPSEILLVQLNTTLYYNCDPEYTGSEKLQPLAKWEEFYRTEAANPGKSGKNFLKTMRIWNIFGQRDIPGDYAKLDPEQRNPAEKIAIEFPHPDILIRDKILTLTSLPFYGHNVVATRKN